MAWRCILEENDRFQNANHIFPTQQRDVASIIKEWEKDSRIKKITIFGSSVTSACNPWSDVDIYVELNSDFYPRIPKIENPADVFTNFEVDDRLLEEINRTGVVVYEK
jgi:predicted nucleotidyltransferase